MLPRAKFIKLGLAVFFLVVAGGPALARAQDNVTIPKSRLEELERKEKELERLRGGASDKPHDEHVQPKPAADKPTPVTAPVQAPPPEPVTTFTSPAMESLPLLQPTDRVESMDLANYYYANSSAADQRFLKRKFTVCGEIVGFEKPLFIRNYRVLLKTPSREAKVICDLLPPENSSAVFTIDHGDTLVAKMGEARVPLARVGQHATVKGECKGLHGSAVTILGWDLQLAP